MTDDDITEFVFMREDPVPADLLMVFAAANEVDMERRMQRGVDLYRAGYASRILATGGGVLARTCPEARRMAEIAIDLGVPTSDLLVEDRSSNTFENAEFSMSVLQAGHVLDSLSTVILVSSEWHMRRVLITTRKYFPESIRMVCCPTCEGCNRDNWVQSEACRKEVASEALLLETFLKTGAIQDYLDNGNGT
jgi:vancomycin permeability regulator SanA